MKLIQAAENKYNQLLFTLILLFLSPPLEVIFPYTDLIIPSLFLLMVSVTVRTLSLRRLATILYQAMALLLFILVITPSIDILAEDEGTQIQLIGVFGFLFFLAIPILFISRDLFLASRVTADTVKGGICVYILIGLFWSLMYYLVFLIDAQAFIPEIRSQQDCIYLSFTILTTVGFGDIVPVNVSARSLTNLEALIGQMYPAIFIARLVSLYDRDR